MKHTICVIIRISYLHKYKLLETILKLLFKISMLFNLKCYCYMDSLETYTYLSTVTTMHLLPREIERGLICPPLKNT